MLVRVPDLAKDLTELIHFMPNYLIEPPSLIVSYSTSSSSAQRNAFDAELSGRAAISDSEQLSLVNSMKFIFTKMTI